LRSAELEAELRLGASKRRPGSSFRCIDLLGSLDVTLQFHPRVLVHKLSDEDQYYERAPREFRHAVYEAIDEYRDSQVIDLEQYLISIWSRCLPLAESNPSWRDIGTVVIEAFEVDPHSAMHSLKEFDTAPELRNESGWRDFEEAILFQISDLRRMRGGALEDEHRYFGMQSPTGYTWYNFDPLTFIECGLAGMSAFIDEYQFDTNWGGFQLFLEMGQGYE